MNVILTAPRGKMGKVFSSYLKRKKKKISKDIVIIDFSHPTKTMKMIDKYGDNPNASWIIGTTGFSKAQEEKINRLAKERVVFKSGNMSMAVGILENFAYSFSKIFKDYDIEIKETHHRDKIDAPSGTAKMLAESAKKARIGSKIVNRGHRPRSKEEIGVSYSRGGGNFGEHSLCIYGDNEEIVITHRAYNRDLFVQDVLQKIVPFVRFKKKTKKFGVFGMADFSAYQVPKFL